MSSSATASGVVFLFDVDNTLIDNDSVQADLKEHLEQAYGTAARDRYWEILEKLRSELGYVDLKELARTRRRNADKVDPGIGRTRMGQRIFECVLSIGTRSAQGIMASGLIAAQTGRTHDRTRPMLQLGQKVRAVLQ
jgi:hypothetical protein